MLRPPALRRSLPLRDATRGGPSPLAGSLLVAALLTTAAALPAVWWEPVHADEHVMLVLAPLPLGAIVDSVFGERGGAPLLFFVHHVTLQWPGGLEGLRLPSFLFFLAALPAAGLLARELCGVPAAVGLVPALALAPLAVRAATFGRMYAIFLAAFLWATLAALALARRGGWLRWALAGALLGGLVYVHPTAPLYVAAALLVVLVHVERSPRRLLVEAWPAVLAAAVAGLPYYLHSLGVLRERYDVAPGAPQLRGARGGSVLEEAFFALGGRSSAVAGALVLLALTGLVSLALARSRAAVSLALWLGLPLAFFVLVPVGNTALLPRYLLLALPPFLLLVVAGCLALGRLTRAPALVGGLLVAAVLAAQGWEDLDRLRALRSLELPGLAEAATRAPRPAVVLPSTGPVSPVRSPSTLDRGRPPHLLDNYVSLAAEALPLIERHTCAHVRRFLERTWESRVGVWIFYSDDPTVVAGADGRFGSLREVRAGVVAGRYLLVRSEGAKRPRALVRLDARLRESWLESAPTDDLARKLLASDRLALAGRCPG